MADNTGSNLGTGQGVFSGKVADDLQFKSLKAGTNVTLSSNATEITINSTGTVSAGLNLGSGEGLYTSVATGNLQLKSLVGGSGIALSNTGTEITIAADSANLNAGTLGGLASSAFLTKADNLASVADIPTARTNLGVYSKTESDTNFQPKAGNILPDADNTRSIGDNSNRYSDVYATELHGTATRAGVVTSIGTHDIGGLQNVDETGKQSGHVLKYNGSHWVSVVDAGATNLGALTDVEAAGAANGQVLMYISANNRWEAGTVSGGGGGGSSTFVGLTDTPGNYAGAASRFLKVNSSGNALEFVADPGYVTDLSTFTTTNLAEGTNEYFTNARADARIAAASINALADVDTSGAASGKILKYNGSAWVIADESSGPADTDALSEGSTNLYFTDARADARIAAASINALTDVNTAGITAGQVLSWNGSTFVASSAGTGDISRVNITAGTGLTGTVDTTTGDHTQTLAVDVGTTANKIVQLDGSARLPAVDGSQLTNVPGTLSADSVNDTHIDFGTGANQVNTDDLPEGSTNLYYTATRANTDFDTRLATKDTGDVAEGSNLYYTDARVDAHLNQSNPTAGYVLSWNGSDYAWVDNGVGGATTFVGLTDTPANFTGQQNKFVKVNSGGNALEFVADPGYLTSVPAQSFASLTGKPTTIAGYGITDAFDGDYNNLSNKPTIPSAYANSDVDAHLNQSNPTAGYVLSWNGSDYAWVSNGSGGLTDLVNDTTPQLGGTLDANGNTIDMGTNVITDAKVGQWDTAYGWGDHGSAGYLTSVPAQSFASLTGKPTTLAGYGITDAVTSAGLNALIDGHLNQSNPTAGYVLSWNGSDYAWVTNAGYTHSDFDNRFATKTTDNLTEGASNLYYTNARADARIVAAGSANWNTAYGWGDHSTAGYQTTAGLNGAIDTHLNQSNPTAGYVLSWNGSDYAWVQDSDTVYTSFNTDFDTRLATKSTTNLTEGTNLYYTDTRADARIALQVGANLDLSSKDTGDLAEGSNLYYTDARADARITNALIDEDNMASDSATRIPSQQSVKAYVDSQVASENELSEMNDVSVSSLQNNDFLKYNSGTSRWENATVTPSTAAGSDTYVQFNDGGTIGGDAGFVYNKTTDALTVGSVTTTGASPSVSAAGALTISTTASNGNITFSPNGTGDVVLSANAKIDGSDNDYFKWTAPYASEGALPSASTYHGMFAHVHGTGKGYFAHGGNWIKLLDESSSTTTNLTEGTNLYYTDARADARITAALIDEDNMASNSATRLPSQQSVKAYVDAQVAGKDNTDEITEGSTNLYFTDARARAAISEGSAQLSYNSGTGVLTFTQDDTDGISEGSTNLYFTNARADARITAASLTDLSDVNTGATSGQVLKWSGSAWAPADDTDTVYNTFNSDFDTRLATKDTGDLSEGSNQYFTNARADARIAAAGLTTLSDVDTISASDDGKVLYYDHSSTSFKWKVSGGGTFGLAGNTGTHTFNTATETLTFLGTTGQINAGIAANNVTLELDPNINSIVSISFEGSTADNNETKLQATDPTADRTINLPDASGHLAVFATAPTGAITDGSAGQALVTDGNGALSFTTISGGSSLTVQDEGSALATAATTLNFVGAGVVASGTGATKTITIAGGGGSSGTEYEEFKINYATNGSISSISDTSSGISSVNIDSAAGGDLTVNFTGYTTPPLSFAMYGYNYPSNEYNYNTVASGSMTLRKVPGGGSSGSPTAFGSFSSMNIRCSESETGASRSFGTVTHAWVRFVMGA